MFPAEPPGHSKPQPIEKQRVTPSLVPSNRTTLFQVVRASERAFETCSIIGTTCGIGTNGAWGQVSNQGGVVNQMLANRYLRTRRYGDALPFYEEAVRTHPDDADARRKLILCYLQTGHLSESLGMMAELITESPTAMPVTPAEADIVPAAEILEGLKQRERVLPPEVYHATMGVILLYLDTDRSRSLGELDQALAAGHAPEGADRLRAVVQRTCNGPEA
jgi:tetratricopeptide (TPR) repeat protein